LQPQYVAVHSALAAQQLHRLQGGAMLSVSGSPVAAAAVAAGMSPEAAWANSTPPIGQLAQLSISASAAAGGLGLGSAPLCMMEGGGGGGGGGMGMMAVSAGAPMQQIGSRVVLQEGYPTVVATAALAAAAGHVGRFL
jgi:hypothetical protein